MTELDASVLQVNSQELKIDECPPQTQTLQDDFIQEQKKEIRVITLIDYYVD